MNNHDVNTKCKGCEFSITDLVDVDENIEVMLLCSFHDCLPEDVPEECDGVDEMLAASNDVHFVPPMEGENNLYGPRVIAGEEVDAEEAKAFLDKYEDEVPF